MYKIIKRKDIHKICEHRRHLQFAEIRFSSCISLSELAIKSWLDDQEPSCESIEDRLAEAVDFCCCNIPDMSKAFKLLFTGLKF